MSSISRRNVLRIGGAAALAGSLPACSFFSTNPDSGNGSNDSGGSKDEKEAPMLAALVKEGKLPPLAERLPKRPFILEPFESAGIYGGTLRRATPATTAIPAAGARDGLLVWDPVKVQPVAGLAESWEVDKEARTFTLTLREGLKWSDGHALTADDVVFAVNNVLGNKTLYPAFPVWLTAAGKSVTLEKVDERTFTLTFASSFGLLLRYLAYQGGMLVLPMHYLKQFHPDFTPPADLATQAKKAGFDTWDKYFVTRNDWWQNPERPVVLPWRVTKELGGSGTHAVLERNPYYWKTDADGRQLPYIDRVTYDVLDPEATALRAANGQIDFQVKYMSFNSVPVLVRNSKDKGYNVHKWKYDAPWISMHINQSSKDLVFRRLAQNIDFRAGLSHAINREEINKAIYAGEGGVNQPVAIPEDTYFVDGTGKRFTEFDVQKANQLLDKAGLSTRGADNFRLRSDGRRLELIIETFAYNVMSTDVYEFVRRYWDAVGVKTVVKNVDPSLWSTRARNGDINVAGYPVSGYLWDIEPLWFVPTDSATYWAPLFGQWYATGGAQGEEPPVPLRQLQQWYDEMKSTSDDAARLQLGQKILRAHDENVWIIGTVTQPFLPLVANGDLINVRKDAVFSYRIGDEGGSVLEQLSYRNPDQHD